MKVLDLFSGIGGFSLALEKAGMETVAFCEIDPFCRKVLKKHWPAVPVYEDVREVKYVTADVICGGFPCQDISWAGRREGINGKESGLWFEMLRIIEETRPKYVLAENVARLRSAGLAEVLNGLASVGYDAEWHCVPGHAVGSPQVRDRIYIVAYPVQQGKAGRRPGWVGRRIGSERQAGQDSGGGNEKENVQLWVEPGMGRVVDGLPDKVDRINKLGNAVIPQIPQMFGKVLMEAEGFAQKVL